jgi:hypothetical protein
VNDELLKGEVSSLRLRSARSNAEDSSMNTFYLFAPQPVKVFAVISTLCACFPFFLALASALSSATPPLDDDGVERASERAGFSNIDDFA